MGVRTETVSFTTNRVFKHTTLPYDSVLDNLYASIGRPNEQGLSAYDQIMSFKPDAATFQAELTKRIGPHGFIFFKHFDHGLWMNILRQGPKKNDGSILRSRRIVFGNPLIAITMLKHDLRGGMFVPVEILVREVEDAVNGLETEVSYILPSSLIAPKELEPCEELIEAADLLDEKLIKCIDDICRPD